MAQEDKAKAPKKEEPYTLQVDVDLVNLAVAVAGPSGNFLTDLKKENFTVYEDKVEQKITNFAAVDAPFAVALVLDTSSSTEGRLARIQDEAIRFVEQIHPDDEVMVISFDDEVHLETDFTSNRRAIERAIKRTRTGMSTQLYEAVYLALEEKLKKKRERKAMVLFTDGVDTSSPTASAKETIETAKEMDALIFPIFFDTSRDMRRLVPRRTLSQGAVAIRVSRFRVVCQSIPEAPASAMTTNSACRWKSREAEAICTTWLKPPVEHSTPQTAWILWVARLARLRRNCAASTTWATFPRTRRKMGSSGS